MEGRPMAPWLSFGGAQLRKKRKKEHMWMLWPFNPLRDYRLKVMREPGPFCCCAVLLCQLHMWMTFYLLGKVAWHSLKCTRSFVFPLCSVWGGVNSTKLLVCVCVCCKGMLYSQEVLFPSTFTHPLQSIVHMHDFQNRLLLHKNAIQWIIYHWMVWFGSQSVSSPCLWKACSVLLPAVYLWAALGPALLIIHETSTGRKRSQHHPGSLSQPIAGGKNIQFSRRL